MRSWNWSFFPFTLFPQAACSVCLYLPQMICRAPTLQTIRQIECRHCELVHLNLFHLIFFNGSYQMFVAVSVNKNILSHFVVISSVSCIQYCWLLKYHNMNTSTHTHRMGFSLDWSCSVSLSEVIFIPVLSCQENFFFFFTVSVSQTNSCPDTHRQTHTNTTSEYTDEFPCLNYWICQSNSLLYLQVLHLVTRGFVLCGRSRK